MNRLGQESSPYLLQHKNNPVDWYPWGEEALEKARSEDKPIILSIGYSACHWCHVMEHESFENPTIARLMNENFVSIKVDREERPDLDQIYQNVAQAMTRSGGWPLTVFLTPDLKPFFGGTYYPPEDRYGRPGFPRVLQALSQAFRDEREAVVENARRLTEVIQSLESVGRAEKPALPTREALREAVSGLADLVDWANGGFGGAPKFPNSMMVDLVWRVGGASAFPDERMIRAALVTLEKMASGGIYDQVGGGFHRYSVDEHWSVPHFEKMLYDNGLLLRAYSQVLLSGHPALTSENRELFVRTLRETVTYLLREMRSKDGVFFAAQDADSEGEEGKFFVWDRAELEPILKGQELEAFCLRYGIADGSNFEHGKTVLYLSRKVAEVAREIGKSETETVSLLEHAKSLVFTARSRRIAPGTDNKVLASWNGLVISGLAWTAQALRDAGDIETAALAGHAARSAFDFLVRSLSREDGRLSSTFQDGKPKLNAYLDDYAFLSMAALDLARFETDPKAIDRYVGYAELWMENVLKHFRDSAGGGFFFTSDDHEKLIQRPKTIYDQAIPSGTGVTLQCLAALAEIDRGGRGAAFGEVLGRELASIFPSLMRNPFGYGEMLNASLLALEGPVVVSGPEASQTVRHAHVFQRAPEDARSLLVCHRKTCSLPMGSVDELRAAVAERLKS